MKALYDRLIRQACRTLSPVTAHLGFVLSPLHFYFPIPDTRDMARRRVWDQRTEMPGVDWNEEGQLAFVRQLAPYGPEAHWPEDRRDPPRAYSPHVNVFGYTSAMLTHAVMRHVRPRRIVEVGCGWSTLVTKAAVARNREEGVPFESYHGIDPFPPGWLDVGAIGELHRTALQDADPAVFEELGEGDILFIDSTHVLNAGSDVQRLYLEILPRLANGVVIHIHDIQLPWEYPREYAERQRWFWNEQYLLQALLVSNPDFEILLAGHWLCRERAGELQASFPHYDPARHDATGSFWMRRRS